MVPNERRRGGYLQDDLRMAVLIFCRCKRSYSDALMEALSSDGASLGEIAAAYDVPAPTLRCQVTLFKERYALAWLMDGRDETDLPEIVTT